MQFKLQKKNVYLNNQMYLNFLANKKNNPIPMTVLITY